MGILRIFLAKAAFLLSFLLHAHSENLKGGSLLEDDSPQALGVQLLVQDQQLVMDNGIVQVTLAIPDGYVTNITYKNGENLLEDQNVPDDRGHWDIVWSPPENVTGSGPSGDTDNLLGMTYNIIRQDENQTEISFTKTWTSTDTKSPVNIDKRYVMLANSSGFYTYAVLERLPGWPAFDIYEGRVVFKLRQSKFDYMAMSDERQRYMPTNADRAKGKTLAYKEAVLLTDPTDPDFKGEVDDKYLYSCDNKDGLVHGWVSNDAVPVGFWVITPSNEFRMGGPLKQDLTSHVGPTSLAMFISLHYAGYDQAMRFQDGEPWKKVLGPVYIYLNSADASAQTNRSILWVDAKLRMEKEVREWPYSFPLSQDFVKADQRGGVSGRFLVRDPFINQVAMPGGFAYVGLAPPGAPGSWQLENKGYQFWTQADKNGNFLIEKVIHGMYSLFAWHPNTAGDYKHAFDITIVPGSITKLNDVVFEAPRNGPTLWEIGVADRTAAEFYIPDPSIEYKIHEYSLPVEKFRQYGLWARYSDLYPDKDLVFTVGVSDYKKDWFFAHVTRDLGNQQYAPTMWTVEFDLKDVVQEANYTLQIALAAAKAAQLEVRFNNATTTPPHFMTGMIGQDNALARHGIHGIYRFYSINVEGRWLSVGRNSIFLSQTRNRTFANVMYDYIRFEGPPLNTHR